jgi:hypothetical protein
MTMITATSPARDSLPKLPLFAIWLALSAATIGALESMAYPAAATTFLIPYYLVLMIDLGIITTLSYLTLEDNR